MCKLCLNKQKNESARKRYKRMEGAEKREYIAKKSFLNKKRAKTSKYARAKRKEYGLSDRGIFSRYRNDCLRRGRVLRGIKLELTFEQFSEIINSECSYCGKENCRGVDRVNSNLSYTPDNTVPCCSICNQMKNKLSLDEFKDHIRKVFDKVNSA